MFNRIPGTYIVLYTYADSEGRVHEVDKYSEANLQSLYRVQEDCTLRAIGHYDLYVSLDVREIADLLNRCEIEEETALLQLCDYEV